MEHQDLGPIRHDVRIVKPKKKSTKGEKFDQRAYHKQWRKKNKDKLYANRIKHLYGISSEELTTILEKTNNCEICGSKFADTKSKHIDHCHTTNQYRGILCRACNMGLGQFKDNTIFLQSAITYLIAKELQKTPY